MINWLESVYSDGSPFFVSNSSPELNEEVSIRIRFLKEAPVRHVFLRAVPNGAERLIEAEHIKDSHGLAYYEAKLTMTEYRMNYQFYLVCDDIIYYYTQNGVTTYIPDHTFDFVLMTDYKQPKWVKQSVFYQIFPERFANGNDSWTVKDDEYEKDGHKTIRVKNWHQKPMRFEEGYALDFYGGDLLGIENKIPYFKELGVTAIYLNPIFEAPSTHKYDCLDYFHVDPHFGGDEALASLSKALHENGMKLILDISINHTGTSHVWFRKAIENPNSIEREFYFFEENSNEYKGWFDNKDLPVLNYNSMELRKRIYLDEDSVLKKWLKPPYNIDGWRFDVADVFARNDKHQLSREVWPKIRQEIRKVNSQAYILAEDWGDCGTYLQGQEWDSPMNYYGFGRIIRQYLGIGDLFLIRNEILKDVPYVMSAEDVVHRVQEHLAKIPYVMWENQFNLFDSHDVSRIHNEDISFDEWKFATIFQFMMIGAPSVYYGDEAGIYGFTDSDAGFRAPMPWDTGFEESEYYKVVRELAHRKTRTASLSLGGMKFLYAKDRVLALSRFSEDDAHIMVNNHSKEIKVVEIPVGLIGITKANSNMVDVFGKEIDIAWLDDSTAQIKLEPEQTLLLHQEFMMEEA